MRDSPREADGPSPPSTGRPKFLRGSFDWCKDPGDGRGEGVEHLGHWAAEAGSFPSAGMVRAFESPVVDRNAPEPSMSNRVIRGPRFEREEVHAASHAQVSESVVCGNELTNVVGVVLFGTEGGRHPPQHTVRPRGV